MIIAALVSAPFPLGSFPKEDSLKMGERGELQHVGSTQTTRVKGAQGSSGVRLVSL